MRQTNSTYALASIALLLSPLAPANSQSYDDVAVVLNAASPSSVEIARYFQAMRAIPDGNILMISAPTTETISSAQFDTLRASVESALTATGRAASFNYLVTTKGVPLRIDRGNVGKSYSASASVDAELALILGSSSSRIGAGGGYVSPYYGATRHFSRSIFGMYLVTRLDGYSIADVEAMIDRSGPSVYAGTQARFVLDQDPTWPVSYSYLNNSMAYACSTLVSRGCAVKLNTDSVFLTHQTNVAGYVSWGSNDQHAAEVTVHGMPGNTWAPGAITETYVSTSGRTFDAPAVYGQSLVADLIHEGASGAKGYVYEPFTGAMANVSTLFDRYTSGFNLAESYYASSLYVSWMDVIIGDPKTSIVQDSPLPVQLISFQGQRGETGTGVRLMWNTASEIQCYGFEVQRRSADGGDFVSLPGSFVAGAGTSIEPHSYQWRDSSAAREELEYRLRQIDLDGSSHYSDPLKVIADVTTTEVTVSGKPESIEVLSSYPNPFNSTTVVSSQLSVASKIRLVVYDVTGREVEVLEDGSAGPGVHEVRWNAAGCASGTYLCVLTTPTSRKVIRLLLIR